MSIKILVVDDNNDIRYTIRESLQMVDKEYEIIEASSGQECLDILEKEKPHVILMDIMMSGMDGMDAAIKIKKDSRFDSIKIIYVTAKTDPLTKKTAALSGDDFIEKPFDVEVLDKKIKASLHMN